MGAVQKLATVVIVGLVALGTLLVVYLANEPHRRSDLSATQEKVSIQQGTDLFVQYCVACHAANGAGQNAGDASVGHPPHIGADLGGNAYGIDLNQKGLLPGGTPWPGGVAGRTTYLTNTIENGLGCDQAGNNCLMPDWGRSGQLNEQQISDIVTMIQHGDWNYVFNEAIEANGGKWPTQTGGSSSSSASPAAATPSTAAAASSGAATSVTVDMEDIKFVPTSFTIPANTDVKVTLDNKGALPHDFSITDHNNPKVKNLNIAETLQPGKSTTITIDAPPGDYYYFCSEPGHEAAGMHGIMHVVAGGESSSAAAAPASSGAAAPTKPAASSGAAASGASASVTVDMVDIAFKPNAFTIPANTPVTVTLKNTGALPHDFSIDQLHIQQEVDPGKTATITIKAPAGTYQYYCNQPGHKAAGMVGTMTVK